MSPMNNMLIAITGGIGSGKSVVARMLRTMGYTVYDCDIRARQLIDGSAEIKTAISDNIGRHCIADDGSLDRKAISDIVFKNAEKLALLNRITHAAVRKDIEICRHGLAPAPMFVETAILYQSEIDKMVDAVIEVTAPDDLRIRRVMRRNSLPYDEVLNRINAQYYVVENPHPKVFTICNDGMAPVLPRLQTIVNDMIVNGNSCSR